MNAAGTALAVAVAMAVLVSVQGVVPGLVMLLAVAVVSCAAGVVAVVRKARDVVPLPQEGGES